MFDIVENVPQTVIGARRGSPVSNVTEKESQDMNPYGAAPSVALMLPDHGLGLSGLYERSFSKAGWGVRHIDHPERYGGEDSLAIIDFSVAARFPGLAESIPTSALAIDLVYSREYESDYLNYPFHLLDNATVIIHDYETRRLVKTIIRPVKPRLVMVHYPSAPVKGAVEAAGKLVEPGGWVGDVGKPGEPGGEVGGVGKPGEPGGEVGGVGKPGEPGGEVGGVGKPGEPGGWVGGVGKPGEPGGEVGGVGKLKIFAHEMFRDHPWLDGENVEYVKAPFPRTVPGRFFIVIPEYDPNVWPMVNWGAALGAPTVAPGTETFPRTMFYGSLLFDPVSEDDFRLKISILSRPDPKRPSGGKMRFGVVSPRHGQHSPGGAENHALSLALGLKQAGHDAQIITTCTDSMLSWNNNLPAGVDDSGQITVRRFPIDNIDVAMHHAIGHRINSHQELTWTEETEWMRQSIRSAGMEEYIRCNSGEYDWFLFVPYLYGTTFWGSQQAPEKSFIVPCYHREPHAFTRVVNQCAQWSAGMVFNTVSEKRLAETELKIHNPAMMVAGSAVDTDAKGDPARFRAKHGVDGQFLLYVGRLQREKNVPELLDYFRKYSRERGKGPGLVFVGKGDVNIPDDPSARITCPGFLEEQDKMDAFAACAAFVLPSVQESFSIVMMEAWAQGRPVIANGRCEAAREHIFSCGGGVLYHDEEEFSRAVDKIIGDPALAEEMGRKGREYVLANFTSADVASRLLESLSGVKITPAIERLGKAASEGARLLGKKGEDALSLWIADIEANHAQTAPVSEPAAPELLEKVEDFADISTGYKEFSHRAVVGGVWSRLRGAITRHLRVNYIESLEGKQGVFNRETVKLLRKLYEELRGKQ